MSDHADIVREWILKGAHDGWNGHHPACSTKEVQGCDCYHRKYAPALAALDALVAERDEARSELDQTGEYLRVITQRAVAAEAERDEALREVGFKKKALRNCREAHLSAEARVAELEKALREIERHAVYFDDEIHPEVILDIARAALVRLADIDEDIGQ